MDDTSPTQQGNDINEGLAPQIPIQNTKSQLPLILGGLILLLMVGMGAYYLGKRNTSTANQSTKLIPTSVPVSTEQIQETVVPTSIENNTAWKQSSFQILQETAVSGSESITIAVSIPSSWSMQTIQKAGKTDNLIKNCADYVFTSTDKASVITVSPVCSGWSAGYSNMPSTGVVVVHTGKTAYPDIIRYHSGVDAFTYVSGNEKTAELEDAVTMPYRNDGKFIPMNIKAVLQGADKDASELKIADQVISSIKAQ